MQPCLARIYILLKNFTQVIVFLILFVGKVGLTYEILIRKQCIAYCYFSEILTYT